MPADVRHKLKEAINSLKNYDDIEAKKIIEEMLLFVSFSDENNKDDIVGDSKKHGQGYHVSRLS